MAIFIMVILILFRFRSGLGELYVWASRSFIPRAEGPKAPERFTAPGDAWSIEPQAYRAAKRPHNKKNLKNQNLHPPRKFFLV